MQDTLSLNGAVSKSELETLLDTVAHLVADKDRMSAEIELLKRRFGGDARDFHSLYVSRFPHTGVEIGSEHMSLADLPGMELNARDREFHRFFHEAMGYIAAGVPQAPVVAGDYFEFGCCSANSATKALSKAKLWQLDNMDFFFFDSFQGLPTDGTLAIAQDDFESALRTHGVYFEKCRSIPGFYKDSLTLELQAAFMARDKRAALINVDCDLHESAAPVFKFIAPLCRSGTIIFVDDYWGTFQRARKFGTAAAFHDFANAHPTLGFAPFIRVGWWGMSFIAFERDHFIP